MLAPAAPESRLLYNYPSVPGLNPFSNPKSEKGDSIPPAPPGRGRKVRGVQTKKDVYNHVLTKYKRLGPFSNPKSEKGGWRHAPSIQYTVCL